MLASLCVTLLLLIVVNNNPDSTQNDIKLLKYVKSHDTDVTSIIMLDEWFKGRRNNFEGIGNGSKFFIV